MKKILLIIGILINTNLLFSQTFKIEKVDKMFTIDGSLADWHIPFSEPFVIHNSGKHAQQDCKVAMAWDSLNLYLAFDVYDHEIVGKERNQDTPIFNTDDLVEIFFDADGDGKNYFELGANAYASNYDILVKSVNPTGSDSNKAWDIENLEVKSLIHENGFLVEIKIPFASLITIPSGNFLVPVVGEIWKGNIFRIDYGSTKTDHLALFSYSSNKFGFHQPEQFKSFEFVNNLKKK